MTEEAIENELRQAEEWFNQAVVSNDVARIKACISEDWALVTPEVGIVPGERFLQAVESGVLSHDSMSKDIERVKVYGDVAVCTGRGRNTGMFQGEPMNADEWVTDVYHKTSAGWVCVLTHLTPVQRPSQS